MTQMRTNRGYSFRAFKRVSHHHLHLAGRESKAAGRGEEVRLGLERSWQTLSNPCSSGPTVESMAWLSRLVTAEVSGQSSTLIHGLASPLYVQSLRGKSMGSERGLHCWNGRDWAHTHFLQLPILPWGQGYLPLLVRPMAGGLCSKSLLSFYTHQGSFLL